MARRGRKPTVSLEVAREWLRQHQQEGRSIAEIARHSERDERTIKKHLETVQHADEAREARHAVFKEALQKHYEDVCSFAERLRADISREPPVHMAPFLRDDAMWTALRSHLPRSPLWKGLGNLDTTVDRLEESKSLAKARVEREVRSRTEEELVGSGGGPGLAQGFVDAIASHLIASARGQRGLEGIRHLRKEAPEGVSLQLGPYTLGVFDAQRVPDMELLCSDLMREATEWEEYDALCRVTQENLRLKRALEDELTTILLRRIVPGKCQYCPV
ncbi:MAG: hypothetical protein V3S51_06770 [Dehalococcoidia bacterium]